VYCGGGRLVMCILPEKLTTAASVSCPRLTTDVCLARRLTTDVCLAGTHHGGCTAHDHKTKLPIISLKPRLVRFFLMYTHECKINRERVDVGMHDNSRKYISVTVHDF
jgi:hypothetical protein